MSYHLLTIETHQLTIVKDLQQKFFQKSFVPLTIETLKAFRQGARHLSWTAYYYICKSICKTFA